MNRCFKRLRERAVEDRLQWITFPDTDEFVLSSIPNERLSKTLNKNYVCEGCLRIHRTWYGSFQHKKLWSQVMETYLMASSDCGGSNANPKLLANVYPEEKNTNAILLKIIHAFVDQDRIPCKSQRDIRHIRINANIALLSNVREKGLLTIPIRHATFAGRQPFPLSKDMPIMFRGVQSDHEIS